MKWILLITLSLIGVYGCVAPHTDAHKHPLPADLKHLHVSTSTGVVTIERPNGWRIIQLPQPNNPTYVIGHTGAFGGDFVYGRQPEISVYWHGDQIKPDLSQDALHDRFLHWMRSFTGGEDSMRCVEAGSYRLRWNVPTASGKPVDIYFYAGAPFLNLIA